MNFLKIKRQIRNDVTNAMHLTQTRMTIFWNEKHKSSELHDKIFLKMTKQKIINYHFLKSNFLIVKKIDLFSIKKKIKSFVYKLKFFRSIKIHFVIFVIHLKQAKKKRFRKKNHIDVIEISDCGRNFSMNNKSNREKKIRDDKFEYKIKWKKYDEIIFESEKNIIQNIFDLIRKFNERKSKKWIQIFLFENEQIKIIHCTV